MEVIQKSSLKTDEQQSLHIQNTPLLALSDISIEKGARL
jgi:hypothetical protein